MRCGGIFSDIIITNVLLIEAVKYVWNRSIFDEFKAYEVKAYKKVSQFLGHSVHKTNGLNCPLIEMKLI